jgi:hypothetical protein
MNRYYIKSGITLLAACMISSQAFAIAITDPGVVGTIDQGTQPSSGAIEIQWAQSLLNLGANVGPTTFNGDSINAATEIYQTGSTDYNATLTDAFKQDGGVLTGWTNYEYVLGKYDGQNAGIVLFNVADYIAASGTSLPQFSDPIWTNNQGAGYQLSHWTGFNDTRVPEPGTLLLLGASLAGFGFMRRKKVA